MRTILCFMALGHRNEKHSWGKKNVVYEAYQINIFILEAMVESLKRKCIFVYLQSTIYSTLFPTIFNLWDSVLLSL